MQIRLRGECSTNWQRFLEALEWHVIETPARQFNEFDAERLEAAARCIREKLAAQSQPGEIVDADFTVVPEGVVDLSPPLLNGEHEVVRQPDLVLVAKPPMEPTCLACGLVLGHPACHHSVDLMRPA